MNRKVRVLVVDDSALMRKLIPQVLSRDPSIEVIGTAMDGLLGLKKIGELRPDVVTLDLDMPRMDGLEMLRQITRKERVPVIVFSAHTEAGASVTLKALGLGAFDFVAKPHEAASGSIEQIASELALKIKVAAASGAPKMIISEPAVKRKEPRNFSSTHSRSAVPHLRHWRVDGWSQRVGVCLFPASGRFPGVFAGGSAHAGRLHRNVRSPPG